MPGISAPLFPFTDNPQLTAADSYTRQQPHNGWYALSGPSLTAETGHLPVRGDLAHIKLAGLYFVPHYAVPMPRLIGDAGATLRKDGRADGEELCVIAGGEMFDVLDMAGGWAWGQLGEDGLVGYVALDQLA
jgi:hypothetical protein